MSRTGNASSRTSAGRRGRGRSAGSVATSDVVDDEGGSDMEAAPSEATADGQHDGVAQQLHALRSRLAEIAVPDEEAYRIAFEADASKTMAANTAHRTRLSKLAADLKKLVGTGGGGTADEKEAINWERADSVLSDFNKVLGQSQREADFALVLRQGCAGLVVDICLKIKDSLPLFASSSERQASQTWRQMSNVMASALKWLGVVCKHDFARVFMLLTNRVVLLTDVALAFLDTQSISVLFLPQVLHVLSLHMKQNMPNSPERLVHTLSSYLLLCGLPAKLRELFRRAQIKGMKLFEGASPLPLLLLRAMGLLGNLISAYNPPHRAEAEQPVQASQPVGELGCSAGEGETSLVASQAILDMFKQTELLGILSVLVSILLGEGKKITSQSPNTAAAKLPQTVVSLCFQSVRILNNIARLDLATLQETLGACRRQELYHLLVCLIDYCTSRLQGGKPDKLSEENELLHETIVLMGYCCLQKEENQSIMCYGEGQTLLVKITSLPLCALPHDSGHMLHVAAEPRAVEKRDEPFLVAKLLGHQSTETRGVEGSRRRRARRRGLLGPLPYSALGGGRSLLRGGGGLGGRLAA
mmetsp:Transcript_150421/g.481443  ORF Transcript_150421/g.481443 Transcript_150421/m.481443 type:complete len:587 (-) Transcript_150421:79-1839(-)